MDGLLRLNPAIMSGSMTTGKIVKSLSPVAWYRFNRGITVATGVSQWDDQSGNGHHLKQGTAANQPAKQSDGSILFDGSNDFLATDAFTLVQPETVYVLFKQVGWTAADAICDGGTNHTCTIFQNNVSPQLRVRAALGIGNLTGLAVGSYGVVGAVMNGASSRLVSSNDTDVTGDCGAGDMGGFTLGSEGGGLGANPANIQVKEAIVFPAAHDAATRATVIGYLKRVGGL